MTESIPNIEPYAKSITVATPNVANLNYTNQDFWSLKSRLVSFIQERFGPSGTIIPNTFNDFVESSIAIMLIENWAFIADMLSFKIDQISNEIFIDTVTEIENAFRLSQVVGFNPLPPIAARSLWTASINTPMTVDLFIPAPVRLDTVSGTTPITIELFLADSNNNPIFNQDIIIPAGALSTQSIVGLEGITRTDILSGSGQISQTYQLSYFPTIYNSIQVSVDGAIWSEVDYFTDSQPRREYRVEFDSNYNAYIIFGNNRAGLIPSNGSQIVVTYRQGGGVVGNIVTGFIQTQIAVAVNGVSFSIPVSLTNYTAGEYGYDGDTIEDIRLKLPKYLRTQNRCVGGDDYKILADQFASPYNGQIGKSLAVLRNYGCAANIIDLFVLAKSNIHDLDLASNELKVELADAMNSQKMLTDYICIRDGEIILVDVLIEATLNKLYKKNDQETKTQIQNIVNAFFSLGSWEYGQNLVDTDLVKALSGLSNINSIVANFSSDSQNGTIITTKYNQIIRPDQITVTTNYE